MCKRVSCCARGLASATLLICFLAGLAMPRTASAFLYRAPEGTLKDNCVVWHDGEFHLFTMYGHEPGLPDKDQWRHVWSATSADGVHWKDLGPVINDAPFGIYAMRVYEAGDRFLMNHGSFTGDAQDVLRLWESRDLVHWTYLGPEFDIRRPDGQRVDHMDVIAENENGKTVYYGYAVGGMFRSEDGVKWTWIGDFPYTDNLDIRVVQEPGGCQRIGDNYYLLVGGFYPGGFQYAVGTFIADKPTGPFRPDYPALKLNGYSGRDVIALWAGYCRLPDDLLLTNYILDPYAPFWWHAPLKSAVVDAAGHLHMGYWKGNEALKGQEVSCDTATAKLAASTSTAEISASQGSVTVTAAPTPPIRWITAGDPNIALAILDTAFDTESGVVIEGSIKIAAMDGLCFPAIGIAFEEKDQKATAVFFETWGQTEIGTLSWSGQLHFEAKDQTGYGSALVTGIKPDQPGHFRILFRKGIFEIYLNDLLVQTYFTREPSGRIVFITQDGRGTLSDLKAWKMSLS